MRRRAFFPGDIGLNLLTVGVIISQGGVHLGQGQVRVFEGHFFGRHTRLIPAHDAPDGDPGSGKPGPPATYSWIPVNERTDFDTRRHNFSLPLFSHHVPKLASKGGQQARFDWHAGGLPALRPEISGWLTSRKQSFIRSAPNAEGAL